MARRLAVWLGLLSASLLANGAALAQSAPSRAPAEHAAPVRLLLLDGSPEFAERVRGQVSDLELTLAVEAASPRATRAEIEALVAQRAARQEADVVAWLGESPVERPGEGRMTVYVWIVGHERVHARRVGPRAIAPLADAQAPRALSPAATSGEAAPDERSATLEAAALVVRSAVRAVTLEREGRALDAAASLDAPSLVPPPAPASLAPAARATMPTLPPAPEADRGAAESDDVERHALRWAPRAGIDWSHSGLNPSGFWSASAGLDVRSGRLSGGASASWSFVEPVVYRGVAFELERRTLVAELAWALVLQPSFVLRPMLGAGAAWQTRSTRTLAWSGDRGPANTSWSPLVTGELVAEYQLAGPFTLGVHGGLRWLAYTQRYVVEAPTGAVALAADWHLQPNAGIALGGVF